MDVLKRVQEHYNYITEQYGEDRILGVFLYGSQNYGLDTELSDVDTKAIYIPTLREAIMDTKPLSAEVILPESLEHCEVKDIRHMIEMWRKQNLNFIEILFTEYFVLNPKYEKQFKELIWNNREKIARYDISAGTASMLGQALHTVREAKVSINADHSVLMLNKKIAKAQYLMRFAVLRATAPVMPYADSMKKAATADIKALKANHKEVDINSIYELESAISNLLLELPFYEKNEEIMELLRDAAYTIIAGGE